MSPAAHLKFDRLFAEGRQALLTRTHKIESAPVEGISRWGMGVVLRPDPVAAYVIEQARLKQRQLSAVSTGWLVQCAVRI